MNHYRTTLGGLVLAALVGSASACSDHLFTPSSAPFDNTSAGAISNGGDKATVDDHRSGDDQAAADDSAGAGDRAGFDDHPSPDDQSGMDQLSAVVVSLRLRCELRAGRSRISVDGNNLSPRNGLFRARVRAADGTVTSIAKRAVGGEVEFDFDSDRNDIAVGATRIPTNFIQQRVGADVIGLILSAQGNVVARQGVECSVR